MSLFTRKSLIAPTRMDLVALALSLLAVLATYLVADRIFERVPHLEDEIAYVWEAKAMAAGSVTVPSPIYPGKFLVPFVVDHEGQRFGKYPLGWPAMLSIGVRFGLRDWVNPLLAGLVVWFTYRLGKKLLGETAGLIAALLTLTSPFFLMVSGSLLSHVAGLALALMFVVTWWDVVDPPQEGGPPAWMPPLAAGLALGALALTRPYTGIGVALPFVFHGACRMLRGPNPVRGRILAVALLAGAVSSLHFVWQYAATGDPFLNPYELWWPYDRVGFGPGYGVTESGHNLRLAWINTRFTIWVGWQDLFGWAGLSWLFLPFGVWALRRQGRALLAGSVIVVLLALYTAYWVGAWTFGPRYIFEGLFSITIVSAAGIAWLAAWPLRPGKPFPVRQGRARIRPLAVFAVVCSLIAVNLALYLPARLDSMRHLYTISREALEPFGAAEHLAPAVIVVHSERWMGYGALLELEDPALTTPFIFVWGELPGMVEAFADHFPDRSIFHYYPDEPGKFYTGRK